MEDYLEVVNLPDHLFSQIPDGEQLLGLLQNVGSHAARLAANMPPRPKVTEVTNAVSGGLL
jgi:hypothetical protein